MKYYRMAQEWYGEEFEDEGQVAGLASLLRQVAEEQMETDAKIADGPHNFNTLNTDRIANAIRAQKGQK